MLAFAFTAASICTFAENVSGNAMPAMQLFGEEFIHGGRHFSGIPYVNPYDLLEEPTQDPMIPFR